MDMLELYLARHGQSQDNERLVIQGQTSTPLSALGEIQAQRLGSYLDDIKFDAVYCSDLERAVQTARIAVPSIEPVLCTELREWNLGVLQKHTHEEAKKLFPFAYGLLCTKESCKKIPDGESYDDMIARSTAMVARIVEKHRSGRILVVSHGGTIRALRKGLLAEDSVPALLNASLSRLDYCDGRWTVGFWNEASYLADLVSNNGEH